MKFPLPELSDSKFTLCRYPLPDAPIGIRKREHFIDNGICHGCGKTHVRTCKVGDLPNLCHSCYTWMKNYSHMDDPYHIKRIKTGTPIEDELIKKAIRYAKVKTMDVAGVVGMSTGALLLHAYKAYKDALDEGASEEEARARRAYIEQEDELWRQAELEEEVRVQEHRQELLRKMREKQRILDAQQARINRLSEGKTLKPDERNVKSVEPHYTEPIKVREESLQVVGEKEDEIKQFSLPKWKIVLAIIIMLGLFAHLPGFVWVIICVYILKYRLENK